MKHRPLLWLAIAFCCGIVFPSLVKFPVWAGLLLVSSSAICGLILWWRRKWEQAQVGLIYFLAAALGAVHASISDEIPRSSIVHAAPQKEAALVRIQGTVCSRTRLLYPNVDEENPLVREKLMVRTRMLLSSLALEETEGGEAKNFDGLLQVTVNGELAEVRYGDKTRCLGWLSRPRPPRNPGEFDYSEFLALKGIHASLWVRQAQNFEVLSRGHGWKVLAWLHGLNDASRAILYRCLDRREAALLDGLMLGNRDGIGQEMAEDFVVTGTSHILSISGLHVALITGSVLGLLRVLKVSIPISHGFAIFFTFFYAFFSGGSAPSIRAAVMLSIFLLSPLLRRGSDPFNQLGLSALLILGYDANQIYSLGFQLSYVAILGMLLLVDPLLALFRRRSLAQELMDRARQSGLWRDILRYVMVSFCVTASAWVATQGLVAYRFNVITPLALAANLIVCPLVFAILSAGMVALLLSAILPAAGSLFLGMTGWLVWLLEELVHLMAQTPLGNIFVATPPLFSVVLYYGFLAALVMKASLRLNARHLLAAGCFLAGFHILFLRAHPDDKEGEMELCVLSVGHGCAAWLELPDGSNLLYDVGSQGYGDVTRRIVAPFLWQKGVTRIDRVVLSHLDQDHYSGFLSLLKRFRVREVVVPMGFDEGSGRYLIEKAESAGSLVRAAASGIVLGQGNRWSLKVLNPPEGLEGSISDNDRSLVLKVCLDRVNFLLCGDIEAKGMEYLMTRQAAEGLEAQAILVPHHGSNSNRTGVFLECVRPRYAIISAWGHQAHDETMTEYERVGAEVHVTGLEGAVFVHTDGEKVRVWHFGGAEE